MLGWGVFLSYGLMLMGLPALAVLVSASGWRAALRALGPAALAAVAVAVAFAVAGFYWFDGYTLVQQRYWQGVAKDRPFQYWGWANLACVVCAIGLGSVAGISRVFDRAAIRRRSGFTPAAAGNAGRHRVRRFEHAEQGRDGTDLAALHHLAHRGARAAAGCAHTVCGWRSMPSAPCY